MLSKAYIVLVLLLLSATGLMSQNSNGTRSLIMMVTVPEQPWGESGLEKELYVSFTRDSRVRVLPVVVKADPKATLAERYDLDNLLEWADGTEARYLLVLDVSSERLERSRTFHIPFLINKWENKGLMEGEIRLFDIKRRRQLLDQPFRVEKSGPHVLQTARDNNINDPDLHLTADQKIYFMKALEQKAAEYIVKLVAQHSWGK